MASFQLFLNFGLPFLLLVLAYFVGTFVERQHYQSLRKREEASLHLPTINFYHVPGGSPVVASELLTGSVVISIDYFKRFLAGLRFIVGGRVHSYETLLDRGRREALMRLKESAMARGYDAVVNIRLETSRLASARGTKGTAGIEILAFGTALKLAK